MSECVKIDVYESNQCVVRSRVEFRGLLGVRRSTLCPGCSVVAALVLGDQALNVRPEVIRILDEAMGLGGRTGTFVDNTPLLGSVPELDSMAVVTIIGMLEDRLGLTVADDEIDGKTFATLGSLVAFVSSKMNG